LTPRGRFRPGQRAALTLLFLQASTSCAQRVAAPPLKVRRAVALVEVARGLDQPVALTFAPGEPDRVYIVEKSGRVRVLERGQLLPVPLVDVSAEVSRGAEQGLLGLAFHPRYAENGRLFLGYTDPLGNPRVVERRPRDPAFSRVWLTIAHPYANHNGGDVVFGPDGLLYVGTGDGGDAYDPHRNGQNPAAPLGKMLRIDVDRPPAPSHTSPTADAFDPIIETRAMGLRNPWRYSFDRATGDLYIADVGQDRYEEVDVLTPAEVRSGGQNFGWSVTEGRHCVRRFHYCDARGMVEPVLEFTHREGCSIIGGHVYRGRALPELSGAYFFADYCTALIRSFRWVSTAKGTVTDYWEWRPTLDPEFKLAQITSFGEDAAGELYLLTQEGAVYRFSRRAAE
jgi:glucose/arabinose dehydrogenase